MIASKMHARVYVATLLLGSLPAQTSRPSSRSTELPAKLRAKAIAWERSLNERAFQKLYLPQRQRLKKSGGWVVIATGKLMPLIKGKDGRLQFRPAKSLEEAVTFADKAVPQAKHRFVFRVGEEGDRSHKCGMSTLRNMLGGGFLDRLPGDAVMTGGAIQTIWKSKRLTLAFAGMFQLPMRVSTPGADNGKQTKALVSTVFTGTATLDSELGRELGLERWEVPGTMKVQGHLQKGALRRARMRVRFAKTKFELTLPVAVWKE